MQLLIRDDFSRAERALMTAAHDQMPFAIARALTDTARDCQKQVTAELPAIFDRPTPFTMRALAVTPARKETLRAEVFVKDVQAKYLLLEETGGTRMPKTTALVEPGGGLQLDRYGNIPRATIARLKAQLNKVAAQDIAARHLAKTLAGKRVRAVAKRDRGVFYVPRAGHGPLSGGFYQRLPGHRLKQLIAFAADAHYRARFGYRARVERVARATFPGHLMVRLREAIATMR